MINKFWNRLYRILVVIFTLINIIIIGFSLAIWIGTVQEKLISGTDFGCFYSAAAMVRNGDAGKLYDLHTQEFYQQKILDLNPKSGFLPFLYPPFVALLLSILTALSLITAYYIWSFFQLGLLIWLIFLLNRIFSNWNKRERILLSLTILSFWPLALTLILGQFSLIILFCLSQMYLAMKDMKTFKTGFWLALLMIKPQTILLPGMMTINKRYWRVAFTAAIIFLVLILSSSIFLGFKPWIDYARFLPTMNNYFGEFGFAQNVEYTLKGVLSNVMGFSRGNLVSGISNIVLILGMILTVLLWLPDINTNRPKFKLQFAFMATLSVFLSLHSYPHDSLILVLPAAIFYDYLRQNDYQRKLYLLLILSSPFVFFISAFTKFNLLGIIRPPVIIILILLIWIIYYLIKEFKASYQKIDGVHIPA